MSFYVPPSEVVPYRTIEGTPYIQFFQVFPWTEPFYLEWEKNFDVSEAYRLIRDNSWVPFVSLILYGIMIFGGNAYFKNRKAMDLRFELAMWNLFLSVFSFIGMSRVVPHTFMMMTQMDLKDQICTPPDRAGYGDGAAGLWVMLFCVSKVFELVDTFFIVVRKKPLMFLHWYHHVTVLLYTWFSYSKRNPGVYFVAMNYSVHAFMYGYYFLMAMNWLPKWFNPIYLTIAQITQMFWGVSCTVLAYIYKSADSNCGVVSEMLIWCGLMYSTYFYLFIEFAIHRFILKPKSGGKKGAKKEE